MDELNVDTSDLHYRTRAHYWFDQIWRRGHMERHEAYAWLARRMGMTRDECHMEKMNEAQCNIVVAISMRYLMYAPHKED